MSQSRLSIIAQAELDGLVDIGPEEFHRRLVGIDPGLSRCAVCSRLSDSIWVFEPGDPENWVTYVSLDDDRPRRVLFWYGICRGCTLLPDLCEVVGRLIARERQALLS